MQKLCCVADSNQAISSAYCNCRFQIFEFGIILCFFSSSPIFYLICTSKMKKTHCCSRLALRLPPLNCWTAAPFFDLRQMHWNCNLFDYMHGHVLYDWNVFVHWNRLNVVMMYVMGMYIIWH